MEPVGGWRPRLLDLISRIVGDEEEQSHVVHRHKNRGRGITVAPFNKTAARARRKQARASRQKNRRIAA